MNRALMTSALFLAVTPRPGSAGGQMPVDMARNETLSVLTYNVHGLPWPIVESRSEDLTQIGDRLASLRSRHLQPSIVVLQEAFTADAARIGQEAGYRYAAVGPSADERDPAPMYPADRALAASASALKGETEGKWEGSGLRVFSDFPIVSVKRTAFPGFACAGFDCLANKGVLLVTIDTPGKGLVQIATTHLNSRVASGVPDGRSIVAYRRQVDLLDGFLRGAVNPALPLIVAGDFNVGDAPGRRPALIGRAAEWKSLEGGRGGEGLRSCVAAGRVDRPADADYILHRARDFQFFYSDTRSGLTAERASIPFGRDADGRTLSDHLGFSVTYRLS